MCALSVFSLKGSVEKKKLLGEALNGVILVGVELWILIIIIAFLFFLPFLLI